MKSGIVKDRSYAFALRIITLARRLKDQKEYELAGQILRSVTAVGSNVEEALAGVSRADFTAKMAISSKEARETHYWLRLLRDSKTVPAPKILPLENEGLELIRMLTSIVKTAQTAGENPNSKLKTKNSMLPLSSFLKTLPTYQPGRPIEEVARELGLPADSIIKVASNENPFGPSPLAVTAMQKAIPGVNLYPDGNAFYLKQKLAAKLGVEPANLVLGNGSNEIIEFVAHALLGPDTNVVVSQYCFAIYPIVAKMFGAEVITVPAKSYGHDLPAMLKAITRETRIVFVANPNNPTGTLASREDLIQFVNEVPDNVLLVMDEAYIEFLADAVDLVPLIRLGTRKNLILMRTFSKIYGLAGLRVGYGIADVGLASALEKVRQPFNLNLIAQAAALAALDDDEHVRKTRANNFAGLEFFGRAFRSLNLEYVPSHANFILVRVSTGQKVFEAMQKLGVITRPMGGYQLPEWIRISVGNPQENERSLAALKRALGNGGSGQ